MGSVALALLSASSMWSSGRGEEAGVTPAAQPSVNLPPVSVNPVARPKARPKAKKAQPTTRVAAPQAPAAAPPQSPQAPSGPGVGYVATRSTAGTKTDTPIMETPQSISVVTQQQMIDRGVQNLNDTLRYTPGVQVGDTSDLTTESFAIRGYNSPFLSLYRDGLRSMFRAFDSVTEPYGLARVEILRGPASVLYGQGIPGGVVNLVTKRPTETAFAETELRLGSFNRRQIGFDLGGPASNDKDSAFLYRLTGLYRDSDTQIDYVPDDRTYLAPAFTFRSPTRDTTLTVLASYQNDRTSFPDGLPAEGTVKFNPNGKIPINRFTGEPAWSMFKRTTTGISYILDHNVTNQFSIHQVARYTDADYDRNQIQNQGWEDQNPGPNPDRRTIARRARQGFQSRQLFAIDTRAEYKFDLASARHNVIAGVDYLNARFKTRMFQGGIQPLDIFTPQYGAPVTTPNEVFNDRERASQTGLYLQDQIKLWDRLNVVAGVRHDSASDTNVNIDSITTSQKDRATTYRVGSIYQAPFGFAPYISYAQSFTPVFDRDASGLPFKPETAEQYEIGVKYQPEGISSFVTLSAFKLIRQNVLSPHPDDDELFVQTGEVTTNGLELEAVGNLTESISLVASYSLLDTEVTKSNDVDLGKRPVTVADRMASLWAKYAFKYGPLDGLSVGAGVRYIGNTPGDLQNSFFVPSRTVFDMALIYDVKNVRFAVNANNIFDKHYISQCFSNDSCYYGIRRTVTGTLTYKW
jgi:iron complex outermembrane receptor protein